MMTYNGIPVHVNLYLPYEQTYDACCLETKLQCKVSSGEFVHAMSYDNKLFVSRKLYSALLKLPNANNMVNTSVPS